MRTIILGLDAFDPVLFENLSERGELPNLGRLKRLGGYARFEVSNPPQSEVSWTSIAAGADPGVHGMFDFVHRDPRTYALIPSLLQTRSSALGVQFIPAYTAKTLFEATTDQGYPATVLWWPALFPARPELPVATFPGLGTPDVQGRLGVGALYSPDPELAKLPVKTAIEPLQKASAGVYRGSLKGPRRQAHGSEQPVALDFQLEIKDDKRARLVIEKQGIDLSLGQWSPLLEVSFRMGFLTNVGAVTRVLLSQAAPEPRLYFLPLQIHPLQTPWRYATPPDFVRRVWKESGPFLTLGWPQDTTALEEGWIDDQQFLDLCLAIDERREQIFFNQLGRFREGVLASVFDSLDRVQHMFLANRPDVVEDYYRRLDALVGKTAAALADPGRAGTRLLVVSDHGFTGFHTKVHLNRWLVERGCLAQASAGGRCDFSNVDWSHTQAYALGLNSLYLNLQGREGQGALPLAELETFRRRLADDLESWQDGSGRGVVQKVYLREEAFNGGYLSQAPDLVVGYAPGFRASADTGLGKWEENSLVPNRDHWGADHCIDPQAVPGVLFSSDGLSGFSKPSFRDIPFLATGRELQHPNQAPRPQQGQAEDQKAIEERLKGLGYL
jgi:predicted AlkP superfamily phosphohydrolase/phosphomutase